MYNSITNKMIKGYKMMKTIKINEKEFWLHPGKCKWIESKTGKIIYDINLINLLFSKI